MTTSQFKSLTREQQLEFIDPIIQVASDMLLAGTLKKNVVRFFTNRGFSLEAGTNLMEVAEVRAEKLSYYKFK